MDARQYTTYISNLPVRSYSDGQTEYDTGTGFWLGLDTDGVPKFSLGNSAGNKLTWNGSTLAITGSVTATTGTIGGWTIASTYLESGSGATTVRLDSAGTNPAISIGNATPGSAPFRVTQAGALTATSATITGAITLTNTAQTFTPTWTGFSADPSGDLSYIDFGAYVMLWTSAALTGTSNATTFTISNLPSAIEPTSGFMILPCRVVNSNVIYAGSASLQAGTNDIVFAMDIVSGSNITSDATGFANTSGKGLPAGWLIVYPTG